jgi:hypothetical protein
MNAETLVDQFRGWLLRPRVVHRLPGRLRLSCPALMQLDETNRDWALVWRDLLGGVAEIESVDVSLTTGSVLIRYDPDRLAEAELIAFLGALNRVALRHWDRLAAVPAAELPETLRRMVGAIRAGVRRGLALDGEIEIPTDV